MRLKRQSRRSPPKKARRHQSRPQRPTAPAPRAKASSSRAHERANDVVAAKKAPNTISTIAVNLWEPEMRDRVKAVLNPGARPEDRGC